MELAPLSLMLQRARLAEERAAAARRAASAQAQRSRALHAQLLQYGLEYRGAALQGATAGFQADARAFGARLESTAHEQDQLASLQEHEAAAAERAWQQARLQAEQLQRLQQRVQQLQARRAQRSAELALEDLLQARAARERP